MQTSPPDRPPRPLAASFRSAFAIVRPHLPRLAGGLAILVVNRVAGLALPASTRVLIDDIIGQGHFDRLMSLLTAIVAATALQATTSYVLLQLLSKGSHRLIAQLRQDLASHVTRLPVTFHETHKSGALVTRILNDPEGLRNLVGSGLVELAGGLITGSIALSLMLSISLTMTLVTLVSLAAFSALVGWIFSRMRPAFRERGQITSEVAGRLTECMAGIRVVKGYAAEGREAEVLGVGVRRLLDNALSTVSQYSLMSFASNMLLGVVGCGIMYVGVRQITAGALTVGGLFTYLMLVGFLVAPVFQVVGVGTQITEAMAGLDRVQEILAIEPEGRDPARVVQIGPIRGDLRFDGVGFEYQPGQPVLSDISFAAPAGTVTAIVGASGAGKSTMIGLIAAFHKPTTGTVLVDGVDLATVSLQSYRSQLGVVLQETFLFDGTVRENVAFSRPGAAEAEVLEACRIAHVDEFAQRLPHGLETLVGERGVRLSGGQRQRVAIARAVLARPAILILDEATSSLDSESEAAIQSGLAHLLEGRSTFVIAHRLSTIRRAHRILVLKGGRIVETGTHDELLAARGPYFEMSRRQQDLAADLFVPAA